VYIHKYYTVDEHEQRLDLTRLNYLCLLLSLTCFYIPIWHWWGQVIRLLFSWK